MFIPIASFDVVAVAVAGVAVAGVAVLLVGNSHAMCMMFWFLFVHCFVSFVLFPVLGGRGGGGVSQ